MACDWLNLGVWFCSVGYLKSRGQVEGASLLVCYLLFFHPARLQVAWLVGLYVVASVCMFTTGNITASFVVFCCFYNFCLEKKKGLFGEIIARRYELPQSTLSAILKNKEKFKHLFATSKLKPGIKRCRLATYRRLFLAGLRVLEHRKYRRPRSRPHLIDHIFGARITLILLFASLFY